MSDLPRMLRIRQRFPASAPLDIEASVAAEFARLAPALRPGMRVALGVGSRGIAHLLEIVTAVIAQVRAAGAEPLVIPAMGSHGGATPEGQLEVLATYGITEESLGVPIHASLDVREVGLSTDEVPVYCSTDALAADAILLINRIKPHTDFFGAIGSGLLKMCVIGLGKRAGATAMHLAATQFGYERVIRDMARVLIERTPVIGGLAVLENQWHDTARIVAVPRAEMATAEDALLAQARAMMPLLPFDDIDLLIVDRIGKNISGTGLDPNVINRSIHGYDSLPMRGERRDLFIRRIFVRGLSPETHGNAIGIGLADATTTRLVAAMDPRKTSINALTALTPQSAKVPIVFEHDREAIEHLLASLPLENPRAARIVHIADTLTLTEMEISEALEPLARASSTLEIVREPIPPTFDAEGNLPAIC